MSATQAGRLTGDMTAVMSRPRSRFRTPSGRRFAAAAAVAAVLSIAFTFWIGFKIGGDRSVTVVDDIGEAVAAMIAAGSCGLASWRAAGRMRVAWGLLAASALSWGIGEVIWTVIEVVLQQQPFPSAADAFFLPAVPLAVAAVLTFPSAPSRITTQAQAILDGSIVALCLILVSWTFGLASVYEGSASDPMAKLLGAAYPVGDIVVIAALLLAMRRATPSQRGTMALLLGGLAAAAVADSSFSYLQASGVYTSTGNVTDAGWVIGYLMIALAPFWPAPFSDKVSRHEGPTDLWQMSVPWLALLVAALVTLARAAQGHGLDQFQTAIGGGLGVLLVASMVLLHRDSLALLAVRDRAEQQLEQRTSLLNEVVTHAPLGVVRVSPEYRVLEANPRMGSLLHAPAQIMLGSLVSDFLSPEEAVRVLELFKPLDSGEADTIENDSPVKRADGSEVWLHWSVTAVRNRKGKLEYYLAMFEDITSKHEAEETAAANLAGLERLNQLKSEFVSMVSHEFRTALVGIQGFSELLMDESTGPDEVKALAGDINSDALRLNRMITEMLDLDRMEAGKVRLSPKPVDLNGLVREVVGRARAAGDAHHITTELDEALPIISADPDRLIQVISNLISNAVKYSPDGGDVNVITERQDGHVRVAVTDHGLGIAPENIGRVFGRYERFESNKTSTVVGTGLGLAISRQIIELHGGKIWVDSKVGEGSTFQFTLPARVAAVSDAALEAAQ